MPHLLLYGPPGIGKTSTILAVARKLFGTQMHNMVLELNASDERGIDVLRQQMQDVFEHLPIQKKGDSRLYVYISHVFVIQVGDCVLMRPSDSDKPPYVARVEKLKADHRNSDDQNVEGLKIATGHVAANTIRLLISGCQAGGLIGVSGQNIGQLRNSSGAT
ncbi:uncharacterized protein LOC111921333 [Lactuca sativa]|uniref:uncharacterized protein LOC111921333 n=1 Tax=Lactuca sativa TaxID=4236 RepID=UPI000CD9EFB6|nr:uncharacterized protein LOC111921333 [Lactuca sativa]